MYLHNYLLINNNDKNNDDDDDADDDDDDDDDDNNNNGLYNSNTEKNKKRNIQWNILLNTDAKINIISAVSILDNIEVDLECRHHTLTAMPH